MPHFRKQSFKLMRSQSISLQIPVAPEWAMSMISPLLTPSSPTGTLPINIPEFQRVTISGDYCAGVGGKLLYIYIWISEAKKSTSKWHQFSYNLHDQLRCVFKVKYFECGGRLVDSFKKESIMSVHDTVITVWIFILCWSMNRLFCMCPHLLLLKVH